MNLILLDAATLGEGLDFNMLNRFGKVICYKNSTPEEACARMADADILLINKVKINANNLATAKHLKLICIFATGYDNVDLAACRAAGVAVCNVKGYSTHSVAQLTVLMTLMLTEKLDAYTKAVINGDYQKSDVANRLTPIYHELCGKTWGIIGAGAIGSQVARVAEAFGCRVLVCKRTPCEAFTCVSLDTLLSASDIISLHTPLNDSTRGLIGARELSLMKSDAILINVARGAVTDEAAVADAVLSGRLGGFGCDVYSAEPFGDSHPFARLIGRDNVLLTPHMAWGALEARVRCLDEVVKNIDAFFGGEIRCRIDL